MIHELKIWPHFYAAVKSGKKKFEIRSTQDRKFIVGDILRLRAYDPESKKFLSDEFVDVVVTYILTPKDYPIFIDPDCVIMSIELKGIDNETI